MSKTEHLQQARHFVRQQISKFPEIMEEEPELWWMGTVRLLLSFREKLQSSVNAEICEYFDSQLTKLLEEMRSAGTLTPSGRDDFASLADHLIMNFSMEIAKPFEKKETFVVTHFLPLSEMVKNQSDRFFAEKKLINGESCIILHVKHPTGNDWQTIPLPDKRQVWHKGGPARAVLDVVAHAPLSMQESEFPWHDFDALVANKRRNKIAAINIGVDADGIEYMGENELNFIRYCAGRDTTQNQVCLGAEGLYYSEEAYKTAVTGHTRIENEYVANKAIYGFDKIIIQGEHLAKPRGLMRLIKAVVEGKALSFDHLPLNACLDLGTNSLFLAKRWSKKEHFPENLQRMYYLLKQMKQVRAGEGNIFDTLERAHAEHPYFDFDSEVRSPIEVVRWKSRKLVKQIDREMGWRFKIPTGMEIKRERGDNIPVKISLQGFVPDSQAMEIGKIWNQFLARSRQRNREFQSQNLSAYERTFMGYSDAEELGLGDDSLALFGENDS